MAIFSRFLCSKPFFFCLLTLLLSGCFAAPGINGLDGLFSGELGYKVELQNDQELVTSNLPIKFKLIFDSKVDLSTIKPTKFSNSGTAGSINFELVNTGDDKTFELNIHSVASEGTIIPKLQKSGVYLENGLLKREHNLAKVEYVASNGIFTALDKFQPVDAKGNFQPIGEFENSLIILKGDELYSVAKDFGSETRLSDGTGNVKGFHHTLVGDKVFFLDSAAEGITGSYLPMAFDIPSKTLIFLGVAKPTGFTMYKKIGCSSDECSNTNSSDNAFVFYPLDTSRVLFNADDGTDAAVFVSNGTLAGTHKIKSIEASGNLDSYYYGSINGFVYFAQDIDGGLDRELWVTDGTSSGTKQISGASFGPNSSGWDTFAIDNKLYFENYSDSGKTYYVEDDGSALYEPNFESIESAITYDNKIYYIKNKELTRSNTDGSDPEVLTSGFIWIKEKFEIAGKIYFIGNKTYNGINQYLWVYNPADGSIAQLTSTRSTYMIQLNDKIIMEIDDPTHGTEIYTYSESGGLQLLKDISPGSSDTSFGSSFLLNGKFYFYANSDIYETDATSEGTNLHTSMPEWADTQPVTYPLNGGLLLEHSDFDHNNDLFFFDGESFTKISELATGYSDLDTTILGVYDDKVAFKLNDRRYGAEVWFSDGTVTGTEHFGSGDTIHKIGNQNYLIKESEANPGIKSFFQTDFTKNGTTESSLDLGKNASINQFYFRSIVKTKNYEYVIGHDSTDDNYALFSISLATGTIERLITLTASHFPSYNIEGEDEVLFVSDRRVYYSNGTAATTHLITPTTITHTRIAAYRLFDSEIFYSSWDKIYKATIGSETAVEFINTGNSTHGGDDIGMIELLGNNLVFSSGWSAWAFYTSNKDTANGSLLNDFSSGSEGEVSSFYSSSNIENITLAGKMLLGTPESDIWLTDGNASHTKIGTGQIESAQEIQSGSNKFVFLQTGLVTADDTTVSSPDVNYASQILRSSIKLDSGLILASTTDYTNDYIHIFDNGSVSELTNHPTPSGSFNHVRFLEKSGNYVFYLFSNDEFGQELWGMNVLTKKFARLSDFAKGSDSSKISKLVLGDNALFVISGRSYKNDMIWTTTLNSAKQIIDTSPQSFP